MGTRVSESNFRRQDLVHFLDMGDQGDEAVSIGDMVLEVGTRETAARLPERRDRNRGDIANLPASSPQR